MGDFYFSSNLLHVNTRAILSPIMKLTLCGSIAFIREMDALRQQLEALGHEVKMPPLTREDHTGATVSSLDYYATKKLALVNPTHGFWTTHDRAIRAHFQKVEWADAVVIANYDKNGIAGYVGPNTLMEIGLAFHFNKKIFLLNPIPEISYKEELLGMKPIMLNGALEKIV